MRYPNALAGKSYAHVLKRLREQARRAQASIYSIEELGAFWSPTRLLSVAVEKPDAMLGIAARRLEMIQRLSTDS